MLVWDAHQDCAASVYVLSAELQMPLLVPANAQGENINLTKSVAQSSRVSLWLWSVATNPNSSKLGAQDNEALIQQLDPTVLHPSIQKACHSESPMLEQWIPGGLSQNFEV